MMVFSTPLPGFTWDEKDVIEIPFLPEFHLSCVVGLKTATTRSKLYGGPGVVFKLPHKSIGACPLECVNARYTILDTIDIPIHYVREMFWDLEGCESADAFEGVWNRIHRRRPYTPEDVKVFHRFRRVR